MKKWIALLLTLTLTFTFGTLSATAEQSAGLKLGLSIVVSLANSTDASDSEGLAQSDSDAIAVLVDADGKIVDLAIDSAQTKLPFTADVKLGANFPADPKTKNELGTDYGMSKVSKIGDWDQQIEAFRQYVIGKTAQEVQGIALDDATHPTDADLTAGCTMSIGSYISGVVAAVEKATPVNASATDKVGLGIVTTTDRSADAADGEDGVAEAYSYYAAVTVNADGAVTAALIDSTISDVKFDATGKITSDLTTPVATKQELGDAYGMRKASGIGKEWNEQANALAAYLLGKTAEQIKGIAVTDDGKAADPDLLASVTVSLGDLTGVALKAIANAK